MLVTGTTCQKDNFGYEMFPFEKDNNNNLNNRCLNMG